MAQPSAYFVAHSAFIRHSVTSEAFAMKPKPRLSSAHPKPRLCPRFISPISPICSNPETSARLRHYATFAFFLGSIWSIASILSIMSISSTCDLRSLCTIAKLGGRSYLPRNLASLSTSMRPPKPFSPPRNLSAFSAFLATDGFLRPWKTKILTFVYIFRYDVGVLSDRKHRAVGGSLTRQVKGISLYNPFTIP